MMNDAAAPSREEVRSHKVVGTLRGLKSDLDTLRVINEASQANSRKFRERVGLYDRARVFRDQKCPDLGKSGTDVFESGNIPSH